MNPFDELTYLGQMRRMRRLAQAALNAYGLADARFKLLRQAGNTLFRVYAVNPGPTTKGGLFTPNQYLLRIHQPGYQTSAAIELELAWLAAMRRDANLPVPEPVSTLDGRLLIQVSIPGIAGERNCSMLRWLKGRFITKGIRPQHYYAQGRLMARLHNHAALWQSPAGLAKRKYDWDGLFREDGGAGIPASEAWSLLPQEYVKTFEATPSRLARRLLRHRSPRNDVERCHLGIKSAKRCGDTQSDDKAWHLRIGRRLAAWQISG